MARVGRMAITFGMFAAALAAAAAARAEPVGCKLCLAAAEDAAATPLRIEISAGIELGRMALAGRGAGTATLDPQSGARRVDQGLVDLGGFALSGRGRITGAPSRAVRIVLPPSVELRTPDGGTAVLTDLATDLPLAPMLDAGGVLEFSFGGRLEVGGSPGVFRGRIPIRVEYD